MDPTKRLCKIIESSIEKQNLETLKEYLPFSHLSEVFNATTLSTLGTLLKKEGKLVDKILHVNCALTCFEYFIIVEPKKWATQADGIARLTQLIFLISTSFIKDESLIEKITNMFNKIVCDRQVVADNLLRFTLDGLLNAALNNTFSVSLKHDLLTTISSMIVKSSNEIRLEIIPSKIKLLDKLSKTLPLCGDYETQVSMVEVLARCWVVFVKGHFDVNQYPNYSNLFKDYTFTNLDAECRLFLNNLNNGMGDDQTVFSIPCVVLTLENTRHTQPNDPMYKEFWVDFNIGSRCLSFYHQTNPTEPWELLAFFEKDIITVEAKNSICKIMHTGRTVPVVKMEICFKADTNKQMLLKIHFHKTKEYQRLERLALKKMFQDKFKSSVTYENIHTPSQIDQIKLESDQSHEKIGESKLGTEAELCSSPNLTVISQWINESNFEKFGIDSFPTIEKLNKDLEESRNSSKSSDSFSAFITKLKTDEKKANAQSQEINLVNTVQNISSKDQDKEEDFLEEAQVLIGNNQSGEPGREKVDNIASNTDSVVRSIDHLKKVLPSTTQISKENLDESGCSQKQNNRMTKHNSLSVLQDGGTKEKRRRLFSSETNSIKDLLLSSQEELSAEIPKYKLEKREEPKCKPQPNVDRKNITFSYVNASMQQANQIPTQTASKNIFSDVSDEEDVMSHEEDSFGDKAYQKEELCSKLNCPNSDKKLLALFNTPEGVEQSNIFPSESPNLHVSKKDTHVKRTYTRPKPKRNIKKKPVFKHLLSPDTDGEYFPFGSFSPGKPRQQRNRAAKLKHDSYKLTQSPTDWLHEVSPYRVDPIRDLERKEDEMKVDSMKVIELDTPQKIEIPSPVGSPDSDVPQKTRGRKAKAGPAKKNTLKKSTSKVEKKTVVKNRTPRRNKVSEMSEKLIENPSHQDLTSNVNKYQDSEPMEECSDFDVALDILKPQESKTLESSTYDLVDQKYLEETKILIESLLLREKLDRNRYLSSYSYKTQAAITALQEQKQKHVVISKKLHEAKCLLDTTMALQNELFEEIEEKSKQLEESRLVLIDNLSKVEQAQPSRFVKFFNILRGTVKLLTSFQRKPLDN